MKILLTGSDGFLGSNILQAFEEYYITAITRNDLDLCNTEETDLFFKDKKFDVVLHTAIVGVNRLVEDPKDCVYDNSIMALNLLRNMKSWNKLIHFGSGAELDRSKEIDKVINYSTRIPEDAYGLSKNIILLFSDQPGTKSILLDLKNHLAKKYSANLIGVFVCDIENLSFYQNISEAEWQSTIGFIPLIMPREADLVTAFIYDNECITKDSKTYYFLKSLLVEMGIYSTEVLKQKSPSFKFLKYV